MIKKRRRGTAIVETDKGILLVAGKSKLFITPGGNAKSWESRKNAVIRELKEETGLKSISAKFLFSYVGRVHNGFKGKFQDYHKVFLVKISGNVKPKHEVKYIEYYNKKSKFKISQSTKEIIEKYSNRKTKRR